MPNESNEQAAVAAAARALDDVMKPKMCVFLKTNNK